MKRKREERVWVKTASFLSTTAEAEQRLMSRLLFTASLYMTNVCVCVRVFVCV